MDKRGYQLNDLLPIAIVLVVGIIAIAIGADIVQQVNAGQEGDSAADNVTTKGLEGFMEISNYLPTIGLVVAAALIIGILVSAFKFGGQ
jgi:hypothetical protein